LLVLEIAARDDHRAAADADVVLGVRDRVEDRAATDLLALHELDLVAERDAAVSRKVECERPGGRAGGRILRDAEPRPEHAGLPARAVAGEAVDPDRPEPLERPEVRADGGHGLAGAERDIDVADAVVVALHGQNRLDAAERCEQLVHPLEPGDRRRRLAHATERDARALALQLDRHRAAPRLELDLHEL
jgi:hypothetical protein